MEKQLKNYLNGTANPEEFSKILEALCSNENDGNLSAELLKSWEKTVKASIESEENNQLLDRIHHQIALEESKSITRRFKFYRNLLKIAAILIVGLIVTSIVILNQPEPGKIAEIVETVTTPYGARTSFKLADGSEVWLNSGSTITFPKHFGQIRNVQLLGEAFFKIVKDGKPFVVKTCYGEIEVMGTSFNVEAFKYDDFRTTLVEGSVKVYDHANQVATLRPGQQSTITPANILTVKQVKPEVISSWKEGRLIFDKEPFIHVAKALERWYNVKIELKGERLKKLGYTGTIEMETFGEILELINATAPINYSFNKNSRILTISGR